ncbi:MAG TPA: LLM class flavin-dependent oxidoreductase [Thermomicrobiales bacterium]|nr:LLM class flavin-dependent oxidoreductase [Thermomicrobiales bacterium]
MTVALRAFDVGLMLMPIEDSARGAFPRWTEILAAARRAEEVGFAAIWIPDHLIMDIHRPGSRPEGAWEGWSLLSALAASTSRVGLGLLVSCTAFRNPALLAKMAATVDEISGGRLILGLGAGWCKLEFRAFGYPFDHRVGRFEEAVQIITGLLRDGRVDFQGTYYEARECELRPRGPRPQGPPILIGSSSTGERMLRLAARYADIWNRDFDAVNPGVEPYSPADLAASQSRVDAACEAIGRDPTTLGRTVGVWVDLPAAPSRGWGALTGTPEAIAAGLRRYADAGFQSAQVWLHPNTAAGVDAFAPVLERLAAGR